MINNRRKVRFNGILGSRCSDNNRILPLQIPVLGSRSELDPDPTKTTGSGSADCCLIDWRLHGGVYKMQRSSMLWPSSIQKQPWYLSLDGNSKICTHARGNLYYLICLRHLIIQRAVTSWIFFLRILLMCAEHVLSYHLI